MPHNPPNSEAPEVAASEASELITHHQEGTESMSTITPPPEDTGQLIRCGNCGRFGWHTTDRCHEVSGHLRELRTAVVNFAAAQSGWAFDPRMLSREDVEAIGEVMVKDDTLDLSAVIYVASLRAGEEIIS